MVEKRVSFYGCVCLYWIMYVYFNCIISNCSCLNPIGGTEWSQKANGIESHICIDPFTAHVDPKGLVSTHPPPLNYPSMMFDGAVI